MKTRHPSSVSIKYEGKVIAENVTRANNFWTRIFGYMFRKRPHVSGILFEPAGAIQTTFIKFSLDVCRYTFFFNPQLSAISRASIILTPICAPFICICALN